MNEEDNSSVLVQPAGKISFIRTGKHELAGLLKDLKKHSRTAVTTLAEMAENRDVEILVEGKEGPEKQTVKMYDTKIQFEAARELVRALTAVEEQIAKDDLQRLVAEVKTNGVGFGAKNLSDGSNGFVDGSNGQDTPVIDFSRIKKV